MPRRSLLVLLALGVLAVVGAVLIVTADGGDGPALERVTTTDGVVVDVPDGWVVSSDFDFQYVPPADVDNGLDIWSIAWACPPDGCAPRSLAEWMELAPGLPTFTSARDDAGVGLFDVEESRDSRSWVLTARTNNDLRIVNVAVFHEGADHYVACNLAVLADPAGLEEAIVEACRSAKTPA